MDVRQFTESCIERAGGVVDQPRPHLLEALLPAELEPVAGGRSMLTLALDPEGLAAEPGAELATVGSPFLDALIQFALQHGRSSAGYIPVDRPRKKGLREEVERTLLFSNGRVRFSDREPDLFYGGYAQFNFRVTFFSEDRRERVYAIPVNLWSGQVNAALADRLPTLVVEDTRPALAPDAPAVPILAAYETARTALQEYVRDEAARQQERARRRFAVEFSRITRYYTQSVHELERRLSRETDPARQASLNQKIEAARREQERKLRELGETYHLRQRAELISARLLYQIKSFFSITVDRGASSRTVTLAYDSLLDRLEPPVCDSCHRETTRIQISPAAQLLCPACA